ncbi:MAG TPA: hypothetical protein VD970_06395, partial [Acetobacteraceae bacterium]|nr:hypothetical protein [Acetobacteraceae bacterium]
AGRSASIALDSRVAGPKGGSVVGDAATGFASIRTVWFHAAGANGAVIASEVLILLTKFMAAAERKALASAPLPSSPSETVRTREHSLRQSHCELRSPPSIAAARKRRISACLAAELLTNERRRSTPQTM